MKFIKEKKTPTPTLPKEEKVATIRTTRLFFLLVTLFLIISGPIGFIKSTQMQGLIRKEQMILTKTIQKELEKNINTPVTSELYKQFLQPFITAYINIPAEQQAFEKRFTSLQETYFTITLEEEKNTGTERKLLSSDFYDLVNENGQLVAQYRISYEITAPVTKERDVKKKEGDKEVVIKEKYIDYEKIENQALLNIHFTQLKNQSFKVTAYPYFTIEPSLTSQNGQSQMLDISQYQQVDNKEEKTVISFIQSFLDKYVSASLEDMAFMMKEPEILTGNYQISNSQIEPFFKDKQLFAFVTFDVIDGETKIGHKETMTLLLKQRESTYFIETIHHYLGGI
ncbi:TPA_asm: conjugal transfer protein [Listeria monocytogenes]|uniref:conjugal transfer protein n=1 Tax=Bacilli TaxID=91061 RepID=UPI000556DF80|nr:MULTISPECIES: conjugal transfer protein [Bacilli]EAC4461053.1 conjugal transfer protein [Listeria monocytogenes]EAC6576130.1 conjugal transfer protein [Listeria monocytogenes]EAC6588633.1 conjugal transfer protein [Listeria monocytogenes]EAD5698211.1 conjugal transfer protein [Listeria monocytogenes]EAD5702756.1 conjugal transfer protein [Listeria monocytogenes]